MLTKQNLQFALPTFQQDQWLHAKQKEAKGKTKKLQCQFWQLGFYKGKKNLICRLCRKKEEIKLAGQKDLKKLEPTTILRTELQIIAQKKVGTTQK